MSLRQRSGPNMRTFTLLLTFFGLVTQLSGQVGSARFAQSTPMQSDRVEDSYAIYSLLLKNGPIEWRDVSRTQWLIEDTTNATSLNEACRPAPQADPLSINPHVAVRAPADKQTEWSEVLADYDQHCHDVIQLDRHSFRTELPIHLLNAADKHNFMKDPRNPPAEFAEGAGLHRFTKVFFNSNHTLALAGEGMWCGSLCGNWTWVVLEHKEDRWKILPWWHTVTVS